MTLNDEELSRILSAHAATQLIRGGWRWADDPWEWQYERPVGGCIVQVAKVIPDRLEAFGRSPLLAELFDMMYDPTWSPEILLEFVDHLA